MADLNKQNKQQQQNNLRNNNAAANILSTLNFSSIKEIPGVENAFIVSRYDSQQKKQIFSIVDQSGNQLPNTPDFTDHTTTAIWQRGKSILDYTALSKSKDKSKYTRRVRISFKPINTNKRTYITLPDYNEEEIEEEKVANNKKDTKSVEQEIKLVEQENKPIEQEAKTNNIINIQQSPEVKVEEDNQKSSDDINPKTSSEIKLEDNQQKNNEINEQKSTENKVEDNNNTINSQAQELSENIEVAGIKAPRTGFGLRTIGNRGKDREGAERTIATAIKNGYRNFDTAQEYKNEEFLGNVIKQSKIPRGEFFITTKISPIGKITQNNFVESISGANGSLNKLQMSHVDLVLLHSFIYDKTRMEAALDALITLWKNKKTKHIGVSNLSLQELKYTQEYIQKKTNGQLKISCNQIEFNVLLKNKKEKEALFEYAKQNDILITAYSPLCTPSKIINNEQKTLSENKTVTQLAAKYGISPQSLALAYVLRKGVMTLPSSINPQHQKENLNARKIIINEEDMKLLDSIEINDGLYQDNREYFNQN